MAVLTDSGVFGTQRRQLFSFVITHTWTVRL